MILSVVSYPDCPCCVSGSGPGSETGSGPGSGTGSGEGSGEGSGSGSGSGGDTVTVPCCLEPIPIRLFATFSAGQTGTFEINFVGETAPGNFLWQGFINFDSGFCVGLTSRLDVVCHDGEWQWSLVAEEGGACTGANVEGGFDSFSCSPFLITDTAPPQATCCNLGFQIAISA